MTAIEIVAPGGPEVLEPRRRPVPLPGRGELLLRVRAAGVNRPDLLQRQGHYPPPVGAPDIPGLEVSGEVLALGEGASRFKEGDKVLALVSGGGYAQYSVAPEGQCLPMPPGLDFVSAAALPETVFTVFSNVFERGALKAGETLLVHGGTSGIGTIAIQMARCFEAKVFATAGSPAKCRACLDLGAERAFDRGREDFVAKVLEASQGRGVDVVLDMAGGDYLRKNLKVLAEDGRLVQIAYLRGPIGEVDIRDVMQRRLTITGSTLRGRSVDEKSRIARSIEAKVWPHVAAGRLRPVVSSTFALEDAKEAHRLLEAGENVGKIVLKV